MHPHEIELPQSIEHGTAIALRRLGSSDRPGHDVDILLIEQSSEPPDLGLVPSGMMSVEEATDHEVGLARAAVVRAIFEGAQVFVHSALSNGKRPAGQRAAGPTAPM